MAKHFRTSDLAKAVGIHPNTVRRYEDWGLLPPVERSPSGYRRFTQAHMDCLRIVRLVYGGLYPGRALRRSGYEVIQRVVAGDLGGALEQAYHHLALVQAERAQSEAAVALLERWAGGVLAERSGPARRIGDTAALLGVTRDVLRNWERNGLLEVPRQAGSSYRLYGAAEISRLRVIRMLSRAGYSQMAILRMLLQLDAGGEVDLREALDTPRPDEDVYSAADQWLSTLGDQEQAAREIIRTLEKFIQESSQGNP